MGKHFKNTGATIGPLLVLLALLCLGAGIPDPGLELDPVVSPANGVKVRQIGPDEAFSFLAAGHIFGKPGSSHYPAPSLISRLDEFNHSEHAFFMSLGDNFRQMDSTYIAMYRKYFLDRLKLPLFNCAGNHDLMPHRYNDYYGKDYEGYGAVFGPAYYRFRVGSALFLVLDSEDDLWAISGDQLDFFRKTLDVECHPDKGIHSLFIFSHKMLWNNPEYGNFRQTLIPILNNTAKRVPIHWFSGDLPGHPMIWRQEPDQPIYYYDIALADDENDLMAEVRIGADHTVEVIPVSLTAQAAPPLDSLYSEEVLPDEWKEPIYTVKPPKAKSKWQQMLDHNFFWNGIGIGAGIVLLLAGGIAFLRRKKK